MIYFSLQPSQMHAELSPESTRTSRSDRKRCLHIKVTTTLNNNVCAYCICVHHHNRVMDETAITGGGDQ